MSEDTTQELKSLPIDAGVAAKVYYQANKTLQEQLGVQGISDWDKAMDKERDFTLNYVQDYLEARDGKSKEERAFPSLLCGIVDALIPAEEKKAPKKEAEKKKDDK